LQSTSTPQAIGGSNVFHRLGTGNVGTCGFGTDVGGSSAIFCWGSVGPLHIGMLPGKVLTPSDAALAVGYEHACGTQQGVVWCWGANDVGQLGVGSTTPSARAQRVTIPDK